MTNSTDAIEAILALHHRKESRSNFGSGTVIREICAHDYATWPCNTVYLIEKYT